MPAGINEANISLHVSPLEQKHPLLVGRSQVDGEHSVKRHLGW